MKLLRTDRGQLRFAQWLSLFIFLLWVATYLAGTLELESVSLTRLLPDIDWLGGAIIASTVILFFVIVGYYKGGIGANLLYFYKSLVMGQFLTLMVLQVLLGFFDYKINRPAPMIAYFIFLALLAGLHSGAAYEMCIISKGEYGEVTAERGDKPLVFSIGIHSFILILAMVLYFIDEQFSIPGKSFIHFFKFAWFDKWTGLVVAVGYSIARFHDAYLAGLDLRWRRWLFSSFVGGVYGLVFAIFPIALLRVISNTLPDYVVNSVNIWLLTPLITVIGSCVVMCMIDVTVITSRETRELESAGQESEAMV